MGKYRGLGQFLRDRTVILRDASKDLTTAMKRTLILVLLLSTASLCQKNDGPHPGSYEDQDATVLSNGRLELTVLTQGSIIASIITNHIPRYAAAAPAHV